MSVAQKLNTINNIKQDIKAALEYKGLTVTDLFDTYAEQIRSLGNADGSEDPFATIGYYRKELMPWLNVLIDAAKAVMDSWNPEKTTLSGTNIHFYPLIDTSNVTSMKYAFYNCSNLRSVGALDTGNVTDMSYAFLNCTLLITIPLFNTPKVATMSYMFDGCSILENIPLLKANNLVDTSYMFRKCTSLKEFPLFENMSKLSNMSYMFSGCTGLELAYMHSYDTSSVTNMSYLFNGCTALKEISFIGCDLTKVSNWENIISGCSNLNKVDLSNAKVGNGFRFSYLSNNDKIIYDNLDTSAMTDTSYLFTIYNRNDVNISNFNLSNVTDMSYTFLNNVSNSIIIGNVNTSKVTNMSYMFKGCTGVTDLDLTGLDVNNVTTMAYMFDGCSALTNVDITGWNSLNLTDISYMFRSCKVLDVLDLSDLNVSKATKFDYLFNYCVTNSLILDGWDFSSWTTNIEWLTGQSSKNVSLKNVKAKGTFTCPYASESIDLSGIDTTACNSFYLNSCDAPVINLSSINTSNFTSFSNMFNGCTKVTELDMNHFVTDKLTNLYYTFGNCISLTSLSVNHFNTSKVSNMSYTFFGCTNLTSIDITNWDLSSVSNMDYMFAECKKLTEIKMGGNPAKITSSSYVDYMFNNISTNGVLRYNPDYNYSYIIAKLPSTWKAEPLVNITNCTSLTIEADNILYNQTSTTIRYTAVVNGTNPVSGNAMTDITVTGEITYEGIPVNNSDSEVTRTISYTFYGVTASTDITLGKKPSYSVNLNNQWQLSPTISNPDNSLYDGVYESYSNKGIQSSSADCIITIEGYTNFDIYVRSYAEGTYDFVQVFNLDSTSSIKATTSGIQTSGTAIGSYTKVSFTNISLGVHTILVRYKKDGSNNTGDDKGYLIIPKNQ